MTIITPSRRPKGRIAFFESLPSRNGWRRGKLLWERDNLFVNAGLPALANLMAGVTSGQYALAVGYGSGNTAPALTDTDLNTAPKYYNAVGSHTFPSSGAVQFNYQIGLTDYGAIGITVQEIGLFANSASSVLPAAIGTANPAWTASHAYTVGNLIVDSNGNIQRCTTAGNSGTVVPTWATSLGSPTDDFTGGGTAVWTLVALHVAPTPMLAHAVVPSFAFTGAAAYQGTWTFTF